MATNAFVHGRAREDADAGGAPEPLDPAAEALLVHALRLLRRGWARGVLAMCKGCPVYPGRRRPPGYPLGADRWSLLGAVIASDPHVGTTPAKVAAWRALYEVLPADARGPWRLLTIALDEWETRPSTVQADVVGLVERTLARKAR